LTLKIGIHSFFPEVQWEQRLPTRSLLFVLGKELYEMPPPLSTV